MNRVQYEKERQAIISRKRSLMMQGKPYKHIITPDKLVPLMGYELTDNEGTYQGFTLDHAEALESSYTVKKRKAN